MKSRIDYSQLYYDREITLSGNGLPYSVNFDVEIGKGIPDCKVGHFGFNCWFRTKAGIEGRRYTTRRHLESAVEQLCKRQGYKVEGWRMKW